jgi:hypothetical protein
MQGREQRDKIKGMPGRQKLIDLVYKLMAANLAEVRPEMAPGALCPLCMRPFELDPTSRLKPSAEHAIPSSLGGTLEYHPILTCVGCNNEDGHAIEGHLARAMNAFDFLDGHGTVRAVIDNEIGHVAATLDSNPTGPLTINVLGKNASNNAAVEGLPNLICTTRKIDLTLRFNFIPEIYWRALLRVAYLAVFSQSGYAYAFSHGGGQVRVVLNGGVVPMGLIVEAHFSEEPAVPFFVLPIGTEAVLVFFKLQSLKTRWIAAMLPGPDGCSWTELASAFAEPNHLRMVIAFGQTQAIAARFAHEPFERLRNAKITNVAQHMA